jgi:hypothetical protein
MLPVLLPLPSLLLQADAVQVEGCGEQLFRFCQQCGKLELLAKFAGPRRSCRASLMKRRTLSEATSGDQELECLQQQRQQRRRHVSMPSVRPAMPEAAAPEGVAAAVVQMQPLSRAVSADDAAAALADAWCSVDCNDSDYEHFPGCSALPGSPAAAAAAGSSDSFLSSLVQMEISKVLADTPVIMHSSSTCSAAASYVVAPVAAAAAIGSSYAAEPSEEELELMIEQELLAAGVLANPAACTLVPPPQLQQQQQRTSAQQAPVVPMLPPGMLPAAAAVPPPAAYGLPSMVPYFAPAAAAALPGSAQATARLERLRVQFDMLQHTMATLQELQAQTRQLAVAELDSWVFSEDVMHSVCYY